MSVIYQEEKKILTLQTRETTYQMQIDELGHLIHLYYGRRIEGTMEHLCVPRDCGFSPNPYELRRERSWSMDLLPQEYSGSNGGDFRLSSLEAVTQDGRWGADLRYVNHQILPGKYQVSGMPSAFDADDEAQTLCITLADEVSGLEVRLLYGVFEAQDMITRAVRITNTGRQQVRLEKAASACLDILYGDWDLIHFTGRHCMEREVNRVRVMNGIQTISSRRGTSSHQHNPFVIVCDRLATEDDGECYGIMPVYSGSHRTDVEMDQTGSLRLVSGIQSDQFSWVLGSGEQFDTPEVLMTFTHRGLTQLSQTYHRFLRRNLCRSRFVKSGCPVLINNWEATYFDFNTEKILHIAQQASALGVEMLVLDDGWFGSRNDDNSGLGDWVVNEQKLPGGLAPLIEGVNALGMKFGLWIEPEMVNEDSDLFRAHPDWAMHVPGRGPAVSRNQLVLDFSRTDVVDHIYEAISALLRQYHIEYIKWDMNRSITDAYSAALPPERQGEVYHRYVLGLYRLMQRLTEEFPDVLFEGCSGGGGRFDAGILAYSPQIWCSDDTDAIERLSIQYGTSFGYPVSSMGAHVSACPNHQTGRTVPIGTRAIVAMSGTFGYEMDLNRISEEEKEEVRLQIRRFKEYSGLIREGDYFRLTADTQPDYTAWEIAAHDRSEALLSVVIKHSPINRNPIRIRLKGLDPDAAYTVVREEISGTGKPGEERTGQTPESETKAYPGDVLMYGGYILPQMPGDHPGIQVYLRRIV